MIRRITFALFLAFSALCGGSPLRAADDVIMGPLRKQWADTRDLVLGMAAAIPEAKYDFRPVAGVRTFRDLLTHLAHENYLFMAPITGEKAPDHSEFDRLKTHDEIMNALKVSYDYGTRTLANMTETKAAEMVTFRNQQMPRWAPVMMNIVDSMDHYGNLVVYFRLNGMVPPRTTAYQAQQQRR